MLRLSKIINKTLSVRLSLIVVLSMAILLMASLMVMLFFSRKAVKEEMLGPDYKAPGKAYGWGR